MVQDPRARRVLGGEVRDGDTVEIDAGHEGQLVFYTADEEGEV